MNEEYNWVKLYKAGGVAALVIVFIIPIQILIFTVFPPPDTTIAFIDLFHDNWVIGLLSLDFLYYINNALLILVYLGLFAALRKDNYADMLIALVFGFIGIAVYYVSTIGFEMMSLSKQYHSTESIEIRQQLLAIGHGLLERYKGTAFDVYYVFNTITLLIISKTMYKSNIFNKATAAWGLIAGIFMIIPSTAGTIGLVFSLISLIPWIIFSILIGRKLLTIAKLKE
ncbi:DUF4386 family protein [Brumimicrobium glaciale]|uniref:DUF4386 family protein n=1 Tax=Brumimicrobium glaciale TaxID=200475 RepID=A0A4Q4KK63_9FLAO|nr:DUF4386 family protein [Brumimicrobium glaciale]RYM33358.1 DUF4386 family protein [Brumimicrobium glaciale]